MITARADSEDEAEVMLRMLGRGFLDLHLGVRSGDIVDPYAIPETMGEGMQMLSKLCMRASVNDLGDSIHLPLGHSPASTGWRLGSTCPRIAVPFRRS
jgi:hypothetical protein